MVKHNSRARQQLLRSPDGPVGRDLTRRLIRVENRSKILCPVHLGRLRAAQTHTAPVPIANGLVGQVGSNIKYSLPVHEGSGSIYAPKSWRIAHARGHRIPARRFLTNALPAGRG